jgi:hypothetical protein
LPLQQSCKSAAASFAPILQQNSDAACADAQNDSINLNDSAPVRMIATEVCVATIKSRPDVALLSSEALKKRLQTAVFPYIHAGILSAKYPTFRDCGRGAKAGTLHRQIQTKL